MEDREGNVLFEIEINMGKDMFFFLGKLNVVISVKRRSWGRKIVYLIK